MDSETLAYMGNALVAMKTWKVVVVARLRPEGSIQLEMRPRRNGEDYEAYTNGAGDGLLLFLRGGEDNG